MQHFPIRIDFCMPHQFLQELKASAPIERTGNKQAGFVQRRTARWQAGELFCSNECAIRIPHIVHLPIPHMQVKQIPDVRRIHPRVVVDTFQVPRHPQLPVSFLYFFSIHATGQIGQMENHCVRLRHPATVRSQFKAFGDAHADVVFPRHAPYFVVE